jgi:hypothetical protein
MWPMDGHKLDYVTFLELTFFIKYCTYFFARRIFFKHLSRFRSRGNPDIVALVTKLQIGRPDFDSRK